MVHKKYIKIGNKKYGPYYYVSYREGKKIRKKYIKIPEKYRRVKEFSETKILKRFYFAFILLLFLFTTISYFVPSSTLSEIFLSYKLLFAPPGASIGFSDNANLTIYDDTDSEVRYSFCDRFCIQKNKPFSFLWNPFFFANYTDNIGNVIDSNGGNCKIRYDFGLGYTNYENMTYNTGSLLWEGNRTFNYKGNHNFEVNCTSGFGNVTLNNAFIITNTEPYIIKAASGFIDFDGNGIKDILQCIEDSICSYNFSANVSEDDINDVLTFSFLNSANTTLTNFSLNSLTGILAISVTNNYNTGGKRIELNVHDTESATVPALLDVNIAAVNDAPIFVNLENKTFNMTRPFEYVVLAQDEENNFPFSFNITFMSCATAEWSSRGNTDCDLFRGRYLFNETAVNISFVPTRNDVGSYIINFTVTDNGIPNASTSQIVNFTVLNINSAPYFDYICDNERQAEEDLAFSCYINATDIDEVNALAFSSDLSWFLGFESVNVNSTTNFKGNVLINFTPHDLNVGNWTINISVRDTGSPLMLNSSLINFYVANKNDSVDLDNIPDVIEFTSNNNRQIYVNASDDDLLIPDKSLYNEVLRFNSNWNCVSVQSFGVITGTNITRALIEFNPNNNACFTAGQSYSVNISVRDANNYSIDSDIFLITINGNNPPVWDPGTVAEYILLEDSRFNVNLSQYVSDPDGDSLSFTYTSDTSFASFLLNIATGVIDFIPLDLDIGQHILNISASDSATPSYLIFNFTVNNINDAPFIERPVQGNGVTINFSNSNMNTTEDSLVELFLFVQDEDFKIPLSQRGFYNEDLGVNLTFEGRNTALFDFVRDSGFPSEFGPDANRSLFRASFIPRKSDAGFYNVTINVTDLSNASSFIRFNLTILEINHAPVLNNLNNLTSAVNMTLYFDINATDVEEGEDNSGNLTYSYEFLFGNDFFDVNSFNKTNGVINITFRDRQDGRYHINLTVNDSKGLKDTEDFWIFVYGAPSINLPLQNFDFNLIEDRESNLSFMANHTVRDNLIYEFYINDNLRYNTSYYGNGTNITWVFRPSFTDETYGLFGNLTLRVLVPGYSYLNNSRIWNVNISHASSPIRFIKNIGDKQATYGQEILINLSENFFDADTFDPHYNQSANFSVASNSNSSAINYVANNWILRLSASRAVVEILNVTGSDLDSNGVKLTNDTSNNFRVEFTPPQVVQVPQPSSGGGGGGSTIERPVLLKLVLPDPVSVKNGGTVVLPIKLVNDGSANLRNIDLYSLIAKDGLLREDIKIYFDRNFISSLPSRTSENVNLTVELGTVELGLYEINVNATVQDPRYTDWGKIYINVEEGTTITEKLVFTEEFIVENPECIELKELVDESKRYLASGDFASAEQKIDEAVNSCKEAISQKSVFSGNRVRAKFQDRIFLYLLLTTIIAVVLGIVYYVYQRIMLKRALEEVSKIDFREG